MSWDLWGGGGTSRPREIVTDTKTDTKAGVGDGSGQGGDGQYMHDWTRPSNNDAVVELQCAPPHPPPPPPPQPPAAAAGIMNKVLSMGRYNNGAYKKQQPPPHYIKNISQTLWLSPPIYWISLILRYVMGGSCCFLYAPIVIPPHR